MRSVFQKLSRVWRVWAGDLGWGGWMWSHRDHERGTVLLQMLVDWCAGEINRTTDFWGETGDATKRSKMHEYITHPVRMSLQWIVHPKMNACFLWRRQNLIFLRMFQLFFVDRIKVNGVIITLFRKYTLSFKRLVSYAHLMLSFIYLQKYSKNSDIVIITTKNNIWIWILNDLKRNLCQGKAVPVLSVTWPYRNN